MLDERGDDDGELRGVGERSERDAGGVSTRSTNASSRRKNDENE